MSANKVSLKRWIAILLIAVATFTLGYFRSYVFISINEQRSAIVYHAPRPILNGVLSFLMDKDDTYLIRAKWILTFLFTLFFFLLSLLSVRVIFNNKLYIRLCTILYSTLFTVALLVMGVGIVLKPFAYHAYNISRNITHITQSPFTILLILIFCFYHRKTL